MANYKELIVWQKRFLVVERVYALTSTFPKNQMYSLCDQMQRAAVSIPSNIAEGSRRSKNEWRNFVRIAFGSVSELETQLLLSEKLSFGEKSLYEPIKTELDHLSRILNAIVYGSTR